MTDVSEWAKREAARAIPVSSTPGVPVEIERECYAEGLSDMAALLLSDEAVEAAARSNLDGRTPGGADLIHARDILEAAVSAVTPTEGIDQ